MTGTEFSRWLATASQQEKETLKRRAGAGGLQDAQCLDSFIAEPSCKARFHAAMGEPTEEEKLARDTLWFARWGFWLVAISVVVAVLSLIVTVAIFLKQERSARERSAAEDRR